jgi:hypothetical protein
MQPIPAIQSAPFFQLPIFGLWVRAAGMLSDPELFARLGDPLSQSDRERTLRDPRLRLNESAIGRRVASFGEWLHIRGASDDSLDLASAVHVGHVAEPPAGSPYYALAARFADFDVFTYELPDDGYYYHLELYRGGGLARRFSVREVKPWRPEVYVREDLGERLAGEPPPGGPIPSITELVQRILPAVLQELGAIPRTLDAPVDYRCYTMGDLVRLARRG